MIKKKGLLKMKLPISVLLLLASACQAFGAGEPSVCASAVRWYDFSDPAYYTTDDVGHVVTAIDRVGKSDATVKTEGCFGQIVEFDGLPALDLGAVGSNIDYTFAQIGSNHTLFLVEALEASPGVFLIGSSSSADFARGANGEYAHATLGNIGRPEVGVYDNSVRVDARNTVIPSGRRLVSIRYLRGTASGTIANFGTDRANKIAGTETTCSGGKKVCEFLAFANELTFEQCVEVENYLAAKWAIPTAVTASGALRAASPSQYRTQSRGDVTFAVGTTLTVEKLSKDVSPFVVTGTLSFATGLTCLPITVDVSTLTTAGRAVGTYRLLSWGALQAGLDASSFPVEVTGSLTEGYAFSTVVDANGISLVIAHASDWIDHDLSTGALNCSDGNKYWISGSGANAVNVPANATVRLRFDNATINQPANTACVVVGAGANVTMENLGTSACSTVSGNGKSAIELANSAGTRLHFIAGSGSVTLTANGGNTSTYGGCGIYVPELAEFEMDATNTTITANGGYKAAGVGSRMTVPSGRIIINAGTLVATTPNGQSACIGTGCQDNQNGATCTYVKITGGNVTANNTGGYGAAIGTGGPYNANSGRLAYFEMTGGTLTALGKGGAAIGSGPCFKGKTSGSVGTVKISGGTLNLTADNHDYATPAVIGTGGERGNSTGGSGAFETVEISGGVVNIKGSYSCGIGAGWGNKRVVKSATNQGVVRIRGGLINISLTNQRWAIGGPEDANASNKNLSRIEITGGNLYANAPMQIQPVNGVDNGDRPVYDANVHASWMVVTGVVANLDYPYSVEYAPGGTTTANGDGMAHVWLPAGKYPYDGLTEYDVSTEAEPMVHDLRQHNVRLCKASQQAILTSDGAETARDIRVNDKSGSISFTLSNCVIKADCPYNSDDLSLTAKLMLAGENTLTASGKDSAAVTVPSGSSLVIEGTGALTTTGGNHAAAIGSGGAKSCGNITINGGTIVANGGNQAAGIGTGVSDGGEDRTTGDFVINGGTVTARASGNLGAGIGGAMAWKGKGGSLKSYVQTGGSVTAIGATGVGGGGGGSQGAYEGGWCGPVKITGGTLVADSTGAPAYNYVGAAIGGGGCRHANGKAGYLVSYEQTGGSVIARGKRVGIGGGGRDPGNQNFLTYDTTVRISGGTLEATGSSWSIGGQETGTTPVNLKRVEITGGCVYVPNGIQIDPLDANDNRVWEGVFKKTAFADPTNVRLEYKNNGPVYTYAGAGLAGNDYLYFYLPNGAFKADRGTWTMTDGVLRYTGSTVVFIR